MQHKTHARVLSQSRHIRGGPADQTHMTRLHMDNGLNQALDAKHYVDLPFERSYWKEQTTRLQTTSRPDRNSPDLTSSGPQSPHVRTDGHLPMVPNTHAPYRHSQATSPTSQQRLEMSSRGSTTSGQPFTMNMMNLQHVGVPTNTTNSFHTHTGMNLTTRVSVDRNGHETGKILEEDSIYVRENNAIDPSSAHYRRNLRKSAVHSSEPSNMQENDSIFRSTEKQACDFSTMQAQAIAEKGDKSHSIYSIKEQVQVTNIIRKKFPLLSSHGNTRPTASKETSLMSQTATTLPQATNASSFQFRKSQVRGAPGSRHTQQQQYVMQQHHLARLQDRSQRASVDSSQGARDPLQSINAKHSVQLNFKRDPSPLKTSFRTSQTTKHANEGSSTSQKKRFFSVARQVSAKGSPSKNSDAGNERGFGSTSRRIQSQFESKSQAPDKDFLQQNRANLHVRINRMHPQYQLWDAQGDCSGSPNQKGQFGAPSKKRRELSVTEKKNALIDAMQKRVQGETSMNATEIFASAGVVSPRDSRHLVAAQGSSNERVVIGDRHEFTNNGAQQSAKEQALAVAKIISEMKFRSEATLSKKRKGKSQNQMVGRRSYELPDDQQLKQTFQSRQSEKKRQMIEHLASAQKDMEGKISLKDYDSKIKRIEAGRLDPIKEYVLNFSETKNVLAKSNLTSNESANAFASQLQMRIQANQRESTLQKEQEREKLRDQMSSQLNFSGKKITKEKASLLDALVNKEFKVEQNVFNQCLEEESRLISSMGKGFVEKVNYISRVAQTDVEHVGKGLVDKCDPKINYFLQCKQDLDLALPILDKVFKKTLVLQEYTLSEGHCKGLARACQFFDHKFVNRVLFSNCGIDDGEFASILEGLATLKDFKSIIYKMNHFGELSLAKLEPLLLKRLPNHLEEIKLIDCQMNGSHISRLIEILIDTDSQLRKFALVNANQTESSFDKIIQYLRHSEYLQELDLSWSKLPPVSWRKFMFAIKDNKSLVSLNISHNKILEAQAQPTPEEIRNHSQTLTERNHQVMECFKSFIKYNPYLEMLNLENTGLIEPAIMYIIPFLRKAQGLRCLHLCANEGINPEVVEWARQRVRAKESGEPKVIRPFKQVKSELQKISRKTTKIGLGLLGKNLKIAKVQEETQWQKIREGLKLRSVINSKRMNEVSTCIGDIDMEGSFLSKRLLFTRHLGLNHFLKKSSQWVIHDHKKDECWRCNQHILTLFLWTPRIGALSCENDDQKTAYYKHEMEKTRDMSGYLPTNAVRVPHMAASFNDWRYEPLQEAVQFCKEHDPDKPDFLKECIEEGLIRQENAKSLTAEEKAIVNTRAEAFYTTNWQTVLMHLTRFKRPQVANAHELTSESLKVDPSSPVYLHWAWVRPGRHTFVMQHEPDEVASEGDDGQQNAMLNLFMGKKPQAKKQKKTFYVHEMLATYREERVPFYANMRRVKVTERAVHRERPVFQQWTEDTPETVAAMLTHDKNHWNLAKICESNREYQHVESLIVQNYNTLTDIYHHLQTKSSRFPWLTFYTIRKEFYLKAIVHKGYSADTSIFDTVIKQANHHRIVNTNSDSNELCRHEFIEFTVLLAKSIFQGSYYDRDPRAIDAKYANMGTGRSFMLFLNQVLDTYREDQGIEWQSFRDERLWMPGVRLIYSMNESVLRAFYGHYAHQSKGQRGKPHNADYCDMEDCKAMFRKKRGNMNQIDLTSRQIQEAYAMSKMTVVEETNPQALATYNRIIYVEFLEFLARVAELYFEGSEMEELELHLKLEYLLDEILPIVGAKRVKQVTVIEEFSESDDDY